MSYKNTLRVALFSSAYLCGGPKRAYYILCISKGNNPTRYPTEVTCVYPSVRPQVRSSNHPYLPESFINVPSPAPLLCSPPSVLVAQLRFWFRFVNTYGRRRSSSILFAIASSLKLLVGFFSKPGKNVRLFSCAPAIWVAIRNEV